MTKITSGDHARALAQTLEDALHRAVELNLHAEITVIAAAVQGFVQATIDAEARQGRLAAQLSCFV